MSKFKFKEGQKVRVKPNFRQIPAHTYIGNIPRFYDGSIITLGKQNIGYGYEVRYDVLGKTNTGRSTTWIFAEQWLEPVEISEDDKFKEQLLNI